MYYIMFIKDLESICAINDIFMIENVSCQADCYIYCSRVRK